MRDPYEVLGLNKDATDEEVKKAYRTLAKKHHPDVTNGDDSEFKEIVNAYEILIDPKKKSAYYNQGNSMNFNFDEEFFKNFVNMNFSDMFNARYGWNTGKGRDIKAQILITLEDAYFGCTRELRIGIKVISVKIPPGVMNGQKLRIKGLGQTGTSEDLNGDLILTIVHAKNEHFILDNKGLHTVAYVDVFDAILGGKGKINVFDKNITYNIPKYTQNGAVLRIKEKGFTKYNKPNEFGDLYISISIKIPDNLTEEQEGKLKEIRDGRHK